MMNAFWLRGAAGMALAAAVLALLPGTDPAPALEQLQHYLSAHGAELPPALRSLVVERLLGLEPDAAAGRLAELALLRLCGFVLAAPGQYALWLAAAYSLAGGLFSLSLHRHDYAALLHVLPRAAAALRGALLLALPLLLVQPWWCDVRLFHGCYLALVTCLGIDAAFRTGARSL